MITRPGDGLRTLAWVIFFVVLIELGLSVVLRVPAISGSGVGRYFAHGSSTETKIRALVADPDLPTDSVFYAGWLDPTAWPAADVSSDISAYGMSYTGNFSAALRRGPGDLSVRFIGGPGAPLSHSYAAYTMDTKRGRAVGRPSPKIVLITLLPRGVQDMSGMTHDTGFSDHSQPATWPVYQLAPSANLDSASVPRSSAGGVPTSTVESVEVKAWPAIHSAADLRRALTEEPALWDRHLETLEKADPNFNRFLYASHWSERFVLGRVLRRAWAKSVEREWNSSFLRADGGFDREALPSKLTRGVLRAFVRDVRRNGEKPVVILFSQAGAGGTMHELVGDVLEDEKVPYLTSEAFCASDVAENYRGMHLVPRCDDLMAARFVEMFGSELGH